MSSKQPFLLALATVALTASCLPPVNAPDDGIFTLLRPASAVGPGYSVGGTIHGEVPSGLSVSISGGSGCGATQSQSPVTTGAYAFSTSVPDGCTGAEVAVTTQPPGKYCSSYNTTVSVAGAAVANVDLYCFAIDGPAGPLTVPEYTNQTLSIRLTFSPGPSSVIVTPTSSDAAIAVSAPLTFSDADYNIFQNVTVAAIADANTVSEAATVSFEVGSNPVASLTANASDGTARARYLVVSAAAHDGNFATDGGLTGANWAERADSFCNANLPAAMSGTGAYRAVLNGSTSRTGTLGSQLNWPLRAGVPYLDRDGTTLLAVANAANLFDIPLISPLPADPGPYWTGAGTAAGWAIGNTCGNWGDTLLSGDYGTGIDPNVAFFFQGTGPCNVGHSILCAQDMKDTGMGTVSSAMQNLTWMKCNFGETWDSGTNSCTGSPALDTFCTVDDEHCNGGVNGGVLTGLDSQIYADCNSLTLAGRSWRVPTMGELTILGQLHLAHPANFVLLFPTQDPIGYYWSNSDNNSSPSLPPPYDPTDARLAQSYVFNSHWSAVSFKNVTGTLLRCVSDGM